jgi:hypothetical protein
MSNLTDTDREQLRLSLLRILARNPTRWGISIGLIEQQLAAEGSPSATGDIEAELLYLTDRGMVAGVSQVVAPNRLHWRITAAGRDAWAQTHGS